MHTVNFEKAEIAPGDKITAVVGQTPSSSSPVDRILLEQAIECPKCRASHKMLCVATTVNVFLRVYRVACVRCGHMGPFGFTVAYAAKRWRNPHDFLSQMSEKLENIFVHRDYKFF
jgi:hypothetical protein